jgi:dihydrofolate reductase
MAMRRIVVTEFVTLDDVMEDPGGAEGTRHGGWSFKFNDPEGMKYKLDEVMEHDAMLLGRVTYEGFAAAWPGMTDEVGFADKMNGMPKYVVSKTLKQADWSNTTILSGDLVKEVTALKQQAGGRHPGGGEREPRARADGPWPGRRVPADGVPRRVGKRQAPVRRRRRCGGTHTGRCQVAAHRHADPDLPPPMS